jgi:hypothetical protein
MAVTVDGSPFGTEINIVSECDLPILMLEMRQCMRDLFNCVQQLKDGFAIHSSATMKITKNLETDQ